MAEDQTQFLPSLKVKCEKSNEAGDRSISESFYVEVNEDFKNEPQEFTAKENVSFVQSSLETLKNESISEENTVEPETQQVRDIFDTEHNNNESVANISSPNMTELNTKEIMSVNENQQMEHEISDNNIQKTNNKQNFMCDLCGCVCSTKTNLIKHKTSHFLPKPFKCEYCPKAFSQSVYLIKHMASHSTSMRLDCHICGKTVASKDSLEKHLTLHSDYKPYSCSQCDKSFSQKDSYKKHIEMHKKEKEIKFKCNSCNLVLKTKHALTEHLKIHSGEKPFHCKECGRYFKGLTILKMHMKLHYNPKKCDVCGKLFASKDQLVKHTRIHTGERPYKCNKCGKGFAQTSGHKRHQNNCTVIKAKSVSIKDLVQSTCRRCGRSFKQKANLPRPAVICNICLQESIVEYEHIKNHLERTLPSNIPEEGSIKRAKISTENPQMFNTNIVPSESHEQKQLLKFISNESDPQRPKKAIPENTVVGCGNSSDIDSLRIIKSNNNPLDNDVESEIHKVINISETECTNSKSISNISNSKFDLDDKVVEREEEEMESEIGNSKYNGETEFIDNKKKGFVCDQCGRVCSSKTNLEKHIASHSVNMRLSCHICGKMLKTKDSLEKHLTLHSNHKPFSCPQCDKSFSQKDSLNKHLEIHQREKQAEFQCNSCSLVLKSKFDLTEHMKTHSGEKPFQCKESGSCFEGEQILKAQSSCRRCGRSFKHKANLNKPIEICNVCLQESIAEYGPVKDNLKPSIGRPNKNNNTEQCESEGPGLMLSTGLDEATSKDTYTVNLKDSSTSTSDAVQSALENYIVVDSTYTGEKMYKCRHCSKLYSSKSDFIGHLLSHQCGLLWKCNICGKSVKNSDSLSRHMQLHSGLKPFACHLCDRSFKQKGTLVKHIEMHNKGEKFECNLCSERFKTDHALKQHIMVHTGEKPFGCATCGKHFRLQVSLRQHEKVHTSPHVCHFCDKEFSAFNLLEKHVRIHTGERPYKCIKCEKGFNQRSGLKRHLRSCKATRLSIGNIQTKQKKVEVQRTESTSQGYGVSYNNEINDHVDKSDSVSTDCIEKLSERNIYLSNNTETSQQSETTSALMENTCKSQTNIKDQNLNLTLNISCETVADERFNENQDEKDRKDPSVGTEDECEMSKDIDITQETSDDDTDEFMEDDHTNNADEFIEEDCTNEDQNGIEKDILMSSKSNLNSHVNETFWKCNLCGKDLKSKETLENHMTLHTDIKPYACNICDKAFSQKGSLVKHVEIHQKERNYECTFCKELFNTSFALSEHVKIHTGEKSFACRFCAKYFSTRMSLRDHEKRHTNPLTCNECGKIFGTNDQMRNHLRTHSGERPFKCNKCGKGFAQRSGQRRHLKSCNSKANSSKDVEMKNANDDFNSHDQSLTEYLTSHQNMDAFSNILSEKAKQENNFSKTTNSSDASDIEDAERLNDVNNEVQLNVSGDSKECMKEKIFPKLYSLLQQSDSRVLRSESGTSSSEVKNSVTEHTLENCLSNEIVSSDKEEHVLRPENVHSDKEEYVEDVHSDKEEYVEDVQSDKEEYVLRPEDVQSDNEDYILRPEDVINIDNVNIPLELPVLEKETIVDYNWDRPSIYKDYIQVIDGVKKYVCNVCHKSFNHSTGLRQHLTLHTGEKPFICEFCGKCFNLNSALKVHTRTHLNTKPYTCEICNKDFACDKSIKNHKLMHAGEIKYSCDICGKGFILLHAYKKHIQSHSGEKSHQCHTCGKSFAHESSYKSHMQMHSGISPYWCKNCGNQYSCSSSLYKHRKKCTKLRVEMGLGVKI